MSSENTDQYTVVFRPMGINPQDYELTPNGYNINRSIYWNRKVKYETLPVQLNNVKGDCNFLEATFTSTENFPRSVEVDFWAPQTLTELKNIPKKVGRNTCLPIPKNLTVEDYIPALFIETVSVRLGGLIQSEKGNAIARILTSDRVNGKMPRELIPGKINELRELQ
jgi:hypothetical protein